MAPASALARQKAVGYPYVLLGYDDEARLHQLVQGIGDRALGAVLDRYDAVPGAPASTWRNTSWMVRCGSGVMDSAEKLLHRDGRKGALGPQEGDGQAARRRHGAPARISRKYALDRPAGQRARVVLLDHGQIACAAPRLRTYPRRSRRCSIRGVQLRPPGNQLDDLLSRCARCRPDAPMSLFPVQ